MQLNVTTISAEAQGKSSIEGSGKEEKLQSQNNCNDKLIESSSDLRDAHSKNSQETSLALAVPFESHNPGPEYQ